MTADNGGDAILAPRLRPAGPRASRRGALVIPVPGGSGGYDGADPELATRRNPAKMDRDGDFR